MTTISDDKFIDAVVSAAHREVIELSEEHIFFNGPDPQVMIHIWHENGFFSAEQASEITGPEAQFAPMI